MVMETDLSMNRHRVVDSIHYINGSLNTSQDKTFTFYENTEVIIPKGVVLSKSRFHLQKGQQLMLHFAFKIDPWYGKAANKPHDCQTWRSSTINYYHQQQHNASFRAYSKFTTINKCKK